jgi:NitT/TauT family transport system substrate-binding protein
MRFNPAAILSSRSVRLTLLALGWLGLISALHYQLNVRESPRQTVRLGYMPVITNLAAPLLDAASRDGNGIRFKALKFSSFAEIAEALRNDEIQAAFIISPLAIVLKQQGVDIRIISIGNRHESTLVTRRDLGIGSFEDLAGKTVAVPMRYSGHNLLLLREIKKRGLAGQVKIVEMNPPDMAAAMATKTLDAYFVGEPFAAQTLKNGYSSLLFHVEEFWPYFICNLVIVNQSLIEREPGTVRRLARAIVRAGLWAGEHQQEAAQIASRYWNQDPALTLYAMNNPENRIVYDHYLPKQAEIQEIADLMVEFNLLRDNDIDNLIDDTFIRDYAPPPIATLAGIVPESD